jgi:hypothetical protein
MGNCCEIRASWLRQADEAMLQAASTRDAVQDLRERASLTRCTQLAKRGQPYLTVNRKKRTG